MTSPEGDNANAAWGWQRQPERRRKRRLSEDDPTGAVPTGSVDDHAIVEQRQAQQQVRQQRRRRRRLTEDAASVQGDGRAVPADVTVSRTGDPNDAVRASDRRPAGLDAEPDWTASLDAGGSPGQSRPASQSVRDGDDVTVAVPPSEPPAADAGPKPNAPGQAQQDVTSDKGAAVAAQRTAWFDTETTATGTQQAAPPRRRALASEPEDVTYEMAPDTDVRRMAVRSRRREMSPPYMPEDAIGRPDTSERPSDLDERKPRRAMRIDGNGTVMIGQTLYRLKDWSVLGLAIPSEDQVYRVGDRQLLEVEIDLGEYAVNLDLEGEVVNRDEVRTGWRFTNPSDVQRQVLRALAQAAVTGKPAALARGIRARGPLVPNADDGMSASRRRPKALWNTVGATFNAIVVILLAAAAIHGGAGRDLTLLQPDEPVQQQALVRARQAAVAVERVTLESAISGIVIQWEAGNGQSVEEGETLVTLIDDAAGNERIQVQSPCDCVLARRVADPGERVTAGATLALLYSRGGAGHIQALFSDDEAPAPGDKVTVTLAYSGERYEGVVEDVGEPEDPERFIGLPETALDRTGGTFARIRTEPPLPASQAGDPANVTLRRGQGGAGAEG